MTDTSHADKSAHHPEIFDRLFLQHPRAAGESYIQHLVFTLRYGFELLGLGICLILHGLVPALFTTTTSDRIRELNGIFRSRRDRVNGES